MTTMVKVVEVDIDGFGYEDNGQNEALFPTCLQEAQDIFTGFRGAIQEMTEEQHRAWRKRVEQEYPYRYPSSLRTFGRITRYVAE